MAYLGEGEILGDVKTILLHRHLSYPPHVFLGKADDTLRLVDQFKRNFFHAWKNALVQNIFTGGYKSKSMSLRLNGVAGVLQLLFPDTKLTEDIIQLILIRHLAGYFT